MTKIKRSFSLKKQELVFVAILVSFVVKTYQNVNLVITMIPFSKLYAFFVVTFYLFITIFFLEPDKSILRSDNREDFYTSQKIVLLHFRPNRQTLGMNQGFPVFRSDNRNFHKC